MPSAPTFQIGGALWVDYPGYVRRRADGELLEAILEHKYCYVLNARQMGKSSLRVQTTKSLHERGYRCGTVDLSTLQEQDQEIWYREVVRKLALDMRLTSTEANKRLRADNDLSGPARFERFISEVILDQTDGELVLFIDEIDSTLNLTFATKPFFATIRECHERQAEDIRYRRLTFVLIGVARSDDLARDVRTTPFNIAHAVELQGFCPEDMPPLEAMLPEPLRRNDVTARVLEWTGGQPFLTHKVFELVSREMPAMAAGADFVDRLVQKNIVERWEEQDKPEHLQTIRRRVETLVRRDQHLGGELLALYRRVLESNGGVELQRTEIELELRLSGLATVRAERLQSANRIYAEVFGPEWIELTLGRFRPHNEALRAWIASEQRDRSRLLEGDALREAQKWAEGRTLDVKERAFLAQSQRRLDVRQRIVRALGTIAIVILTAGLLVVSALRDKEANARKEAVAAAASAQQEATRAHEEEQKALAASEKERIAAEKARKAEESAQASASARAIALSSATAANAVAVAQAQRATTQERRARAASQIEYDKLVGKLASCILLENDRNHLAKEVEDLRRQCATPNQSSSPRPEAAE